MNPQRYALIVAIVFAALAVLQLARAVLGWSIAVTTPWGTLMIPVWLSWIACAAAILLAWFGYAASRSDGAQETHWQERAGLVEPDIRLAELCLSRQDRMAKTPADEDWSC